MAAPRGDLLTNLNAGLTDFTTAETIRDTQDEGSHTLDFERDVDITSNNLHSSLEPSILSFFEDTSTTGEVKNRIDEESEATLLSALSEILDSVIEDTLSPFDTLPDTDLFVGPRSHESKFRRSSDRESSPRAARSQRSSLSNSKAETLLSDRQLRPRLHQRIQTTVQRSDGEDEDLSESRRRPVRTFRIESDPELSQDEQQDGYVLVSLADLVRHMHPYSLRVGLVKEESTRDVRDLQEEDVFVDVVGDDELEDTFLGMAGFSSASQCNVDSVQNVPHPKSSLDPNANIYVANPKQDMCFSNCAEQNKGGNIKKIQKSALATKGHAGKVKKTVRFAPDLASVHEYQPEDEISEFSDHDDYFKSPDFDSKTGASNENFIEASVQTPQQGNAKPKAISLQEYRLLRGKTLPKEERKIDYRTKWPSVPEPPSELPLIPCIPGYNPPQVPLKTSVANVRITASNPKRKHCVLLKSSPKSPQKQEVDPPNPVIVPLPTPVPVTDKTSFPSSEEQRVMQQKATLKLHLNVNQPAHLNPQLQSSASQTPGISSGSSPLAEVTQTKCSSTVTTTSKANKSNLSSPLKGRLSQSSQRQLPRVQIPTTTRDHHCTDEQSQKSTGEIGIQAADVTSLLEQFETQGLTPPATPPHQIWKPLVPVHRTKQHEAIKQSPNKAIQIIEPRPLPPSKVHSRPQLSTSVPAPSFLLAFMDHDYCRTQETKDSKERLFEANNVPKKSLNEASQISHKSLDHRTVEEKRLPGSVLLSPDSSPCRQEKSSADTFKEAEAERERSLYPSRSPSPTARGRTRRRGYRGGYHSDSSSVSSSCSPSCSSSPSSSSSRSPPRKRRRSRRSESSSSSSSRSSSSSLSPSPLRKRQHCYTRLSRSFSRSCSRSRSRSRSPQSDWKQKWSRWKRHRERCRQSRWEEARRMRKQKAIDERRVVYVGRIRGTMTQDELKDRFTQFGKIEDCTVHFRSHGDNYGFVTFYNTDDAFAAIENGVKLRQPDELPFDICFGGRRQFCQSNYADLDSNREPDSTSTKSKCAGIDFDTLLKQAQRGVQR